MFSPSMPSSSESVFPESATGFPVWCMPNPDVDRSAPPRPAKKKSGKKRATKKPGKKR